MKNSLSMAWLVLLALCLLASCGPKPVVEEKYHENGQLYYTRTWVDSVLQGPYTEYYASGALRATATYKDGAFDGEHLMYYPDGTLQERNLYANGKLNGLTESYHQNGQPNRNIDFKDGRPHGWERNYSTEGVLLGEVAHHHDTVYYSRILREGEWQHQLKPLVWISAKELEEGEPLKLKVAYTLPLNGPLSMTLGRRAYGKPGQLLADTLAILSPNGQGIMRHTIEGLGVGTHNFGIIMAHTPQEGDSLVVDGDKYLVSVDVEPKR